jgi:hypothetical protein
LKRWLTVIVGVGIAAAAFVELLSGRPRPGDEGEIDAASRARLEAVLERQARTEARR